MTRTVVAYESNRSNPDGILKVKRLDDGPALIHILKSRNKPSVWTNGVFDILHTGHRHSFEFCRKYGTVIVGVNSDESAKSLNKSHPIINNEIDRAIMVASQKDVDFVVIFDESNPAKCLELIKPDYFIKGGDYKIEDLPENEKAIVESYGGKVLVSGNVEGKSTSDIYERIKAQVRTELCAELVNEDIVEPHKIPNYIMTADEIQQWLKENSKND